MVTDKVPLYYLSVGEGYLFSSPSYGYYLIRRRVPSDHRLTSNSMVSGAQPTNHGPTLLSIHPHPPSTGHPHQWPPEARGLL